MNRHRNQVAAGDSGSSIAAAIGGALIFALASALGMASPTRFGPAAAAVAVAMFGLGCVAFAVAYVSAVRRSRIDVVGIAGVFFLAGGVAPTGIRWRLLGALVAEVVVAVTAASVRPNSVLAFGVLAPVYGLGLCGLWAARSGTFPQRNHGKHGDLGDLGGQGARRSRGR